jgi:hypothetical protein
VRPGWPGRRSEGLRFRRYAAIEGCRRRFAVSPNTRARIRSMASALGAFTRSRRAGSSLSRSRRAVAASSKCLILGSGVVAMSTSLTISESAAGPDSLAVPAPSLGRVPPAVKSANSAKRCRRANVTALSSNLAVFSGHRKPLRRTAAPSAALIANDAFPSECHSHRPTVHDLQTGGRRDARRVAGDQGTSRPGRGMPPIRVRVCVNNPPDRPPL